MRCCNVIGFYCKTSRFNRVLRSYIVSFAYTLCIDMYFFIKASTNKSSFYETRRRRVFLVTVEPSERWVFRGRIIKRSTAILRVDSVDSVDERKKMDGRRWRWSAAHRRCSPLLPSLFEFVMCCVVRVARPVFPSSICRSV